MNVLELDRVSKAYDGHVAVEGLSLAIAEGAIFGLLGPNGAGKTTAIRMMVGIIAPDAGAVRIFGEPFARRHLRGVGYIPEERGLYRKVRLDEHLRFLGRLNGLTRAAADDAARRWCRRLELDGWLARRVEELSKGMQQKAQFIAAVMHRPRLLVLDEPFSGLDPVNAAALIEALEELRQAGATILLSTHRMDQVERLCDALCLIDRGRAVLAGGLREIRRRFGGHSVALDFEGDPGFLDDARLVADSVRRNGHLEVRLSPGADAQELLRRALGAGRVTRFEAIAPSLEEIFIALVRGGGDGR